MNWHKILGTTPGEGMQPKEVFSYSIAGLGQNMIFAMVSSFLMLYYTDAVGLLPGAVAMIMLGTRLFDAFNDPIMGSIVDRTRSRWGKLRPYLLFSPLPIAIFTVICFTTLPGADYTARLIYAIVTYNIWAILYTILDVPYWGLSTAMTSDTHKRATMLTIARLACTLGGGLITLTVPIIVGFMQSRTTGGLLLEEIPLEQQEAVRAAIGSDLRAAFPWIAAVVAALALPFIFAAFVGTKERYYSDEPPHSMLENFKLLFINGPLMLIVLSGILGSLKGMFLAGGIYFAKYNLGDSGYFTLITLSVAPGGLLASLLTPMLSRKFGKRDLFIFSHLAGAAVLLAIYFAGWRSAFGLWFNLAGLIIVGIPMGFANILTYAMIADTVDYLEWKSGKRAEGICFAMQTFISKVGTALSSFAIMLTLSIVGFVENVAAPPLVQDGIYFANVFLAAVSMLACTIPLFFYRFTEKEQARAVAVTAARRGIKAERGYDQTV
jgi:GPH family glycoside/pentoside/hexuronide:cation symporter/probable glucitol transport protein GutA